MRVIAVIPVHAPPTVAKLTIGSLLRTKGDYDLDIHVGVHDTYQGYPGASRLFEDLQGIAQIHPVQEIDWRRYNDCFYRYSIMHATNIENLLGAVRGLDFDYLAVFDHDLHFRDDFVGKCLTEAPGSDFITALYDDVDGLHEFKTETRDYELLRAPQATVWHCLMSKRAIDLVLRNPRCVYPRLLSGASRESYFRQFGPVRDLPIFTDTLADALHKTRYEWDTLATILPSAFMAGLVKHFFASSFNYGAAIQGQEYEASMAAIENTYWKEFPEDLEVFRLKA